MKNDTLKQYVVLRQSLLAEKSKLETRLAAIDRALTSAGKAAPAAKSATKTRKKMSAAGRARIAAAQKARWAKLKGKAAPAAKAKAATKPAVKAKRKMSAAGRARIIAAQKARWAKIKAEKKA